MVRGGHSPTPAIPKVSFTKVEDEASTQPAGVHDQQARSYGYNDFSSFQRPEPYIRYIEPLESELAVQVEYDMDEQDQEWLDAVNNERRNDQLNKVTYEAFEIIMDKLEKEWFDLTKNIPKPDFALPSEDSTCAICDDAEGENSNAIVFCDGCNLAVHQDCYGVPYIPEGQWLCRKCTVSPENPVSCILCPNEGGAFKQTVNGEWAHLLCAIWVPETRVANDVFMEPITGVDKINKQRWKLKCSLCGIREGACIQCSKTSCFLAFHATCARKQKLLMPMKSAHGAEPATLACYCEKHLPEEQLAAHEAALAEIDSGDPNSSFEIEEPSNVHSGRSSKKARAYAKTYKLGPPLVPAIIVQKVMDYIHKVSIRKKLEFVQLVCRYWSLKREARRGAPLLKRLHLEPWTASAVGKNQSDDDIALKLVHMKDLRKDLEAVRMLAELTRKREAQKLKQVQTIWDVIQTFFFPHANDLRLAFERIVSLDRHDVFKNPVSRTDVPDYFDIIQKPMCWKVIDGKLDANEYMNVEDFLNDVNLVLDNAMVYNKPDTPIYRAAKRIKVAATPVLGEIQQLARHIPADSPEHGLVGNLEPPMSVLELLMSSDPISEDLSIILDNEPLSSLFSYELGKEKPPPPPPPPKPPKPKRDRKAEAERRKQRLLDQSAGFRAPGAPKTRRAIAELEAFEAEANGSNSISVSSSKTGSEEADDDADGEGSAGAGAGRHGKRWKRAPMVLPGQADVPPVVDDVDKQRSFRMFDEGWILPSSTRRGGRAPIEKHDLPPPRKKQKTGDRQRSTLSIFSTSANDNQTLRDGELTPPLAHDDQELVQGAEVPEFEQKLEEIDNVDLSVLSLPPADVSMEADIPEQAPVQKGKKLPTLIIEELDTPATRRAKNMARKQRKKEEEERQRAAGSLQSQTAPSIAAGKVEQMDGRTADEDNSDLSSLSELDVDPEEKLPEAPPPEVEEPVKGIRRARRRKEADSDYEEGDMSILVVSASDARKAAHRAGLGPGTMMVGEGQWLEGGTLVWAKAETYPWWPAVVYEEDDPDVPPGVIKEKARVSAMINGPLLLVQFWDARRTWQWLPLDKLRLLGEDNKLDGDFLNGNAKGQRFKSTKVRAECRAAWRNAMAEMETSTVASDDAADDHTRNASSTATRAAEAGHSREAMASDARDERMS